MVVAYVGLPGSGKTYFLAQTILNAQANKRDTFANFHVEGARQFTDLRQIFKVRRGLIGVDELQLICPSRYRLPTEYAQIWSQSRHLGVDMHFTTQNFRRAHNTIRDITNYVWYFKKIFGRWHRAYLYDGPSFERGRMRRHMRSVNFVLSPKIWNRYDTTYLVKPSDHLNMDKTEQPDPMTLPIFQSLTLDQDEYAKTDAGVPQDAGIPTQADPDDV